MRLERNSLDALRIALGMMEEGFAPFLMQGSGWT